MGMPDTVIRTFDQLVIGDRIDGKLIANTWTEVSWATTPRKYVIRFNDGSRRVEHGQVSVEVDPVILLPKES